jgi:hypothetical protein
VYVANTQELPQILELERELEVQLDDLVNGYRGRHDLAKLLAILGQQHSGFLLNVLFRQVWDVLA